MQREAEHRENLATTIRTLRAEDSHKTVEIVRAKGIQVVDGRAGDCRAKCL
jgi:hypothetical protein